MAKNKGHLRPVPASDRSGVLERSVPIQFPSPDLVVAPAAAWTPIRFVDPEHVTYAVSTSPLDPMLGTTVTKNWRTIQATTKVYTAIVGRIDLYLDKQQKQ